MSKNKGGTRANKSREVHQFVYGPVPSRRLGYSLGIDILPFKTCSLNCVYCQLGRETKTTTRRKAYFSVEDILTQVAQALRSGRRIDYLTFSGSGEPTLNKNLGILIRGIKKMTTIPVAVLTNGTLLIRKDVRQELLAADLVVPSLDAAWPEMFQEVNRPHPSLKASGLVWGLMKFHKEFQGRLWLEIMLVKGINDSPAHLQALKEVFEAIRPDRVQLNTVVRPPAECQAAPLSLDDLKRIKNVFGDIAEIAVPFDDKSQAKGGGSLGEAIVIMLERRPLTADDISLALGRHRDEVLKTLDALNKKNRIRETSHEGKTFYESVPHPTPPSRGAH